VVIVGAGPGGLHCGEILSRNGATVLILEKKNIIGKKVCAGGITWQGLIERVPENLIERSFSSQLVYTRLQNVTVRANHPIVATVNRQKLGQFMTETCFSSGCEIIFGANVYSVLDHNISYHYNNKNYTVAFDYLVGADGSLSKVRNRLNIAVDRIGIGINYTLPQEIEHMEWHFHPVALGSGYTWIFPHSDCASAGGYINMDGFRALDLKNTITAWLKNKKIDTTGLKPEAERISCDFRGWNFGKYFLVGDAAGLASPLTGEGIYPAFISAEAVARSILDKKYEAHELKRLIKKHQKHTRMHQMACRNKFAAFVLSEVSALLLRSKVLSFRTFEMA